MGIGGFKPFHRSGFNRARHARLAWQADMGKESLYPVQAIAVAELPASYGTAGSSLQFTLDVIIHANAYLATISPPGTALDEAPTGCRSPVPPLDRYENETQCAPSSTEPAPP